MIVATGLLGDACRDEEVIFAAALVGDGTRFGEIGG